MQMMKNEPVHDYLKRRLSEMPRMHHRIAKEAGIPQSSLSRVYTGKASPMLSTAQKLIDWLHEHDKKAQAATLTGKSNRARAVRVAGRASAERATPAVRQ